MAEWTDINIIPNGETEDGRRKIIVLPQAGGTGVENPVGSSLTFSAGHPVTLNVSGPTTLTLPTSGTIATVEGGGGGGGGTVISFSFTNANGVTGAVLNATTTPALTLTLADITPTSVAASGSVTGSNLSGTNTGDEDTASIKSKLGIASSINDGYLIAADWITFNSKLNANTPITAGTGTKISFDINGFVTAGTYGDIITITTNQVVTTQDTILSDATLGNISVTLPTAVGILGRIITVTKIDSTTNTVSVLPVGGQTIVNDTDVILSRQWMSIDFKSNGTNWVIA